MSTGKKLKELLKLRGIKQVELAKHLYMSPSRLSNYLSDRREPKLDVLVKAANFLSVDLNYFSNTNTNNTFGVHTYETQREEIHGCDNNFACLSIFNINSNKIGTTNKTVKLDTTFFKIKDSSVIYYVNVTDTCFPFGSYLICSKLTTKLQNGDYIIRSGKNGKVFEYAENNKFKLLIYKNGALPFDIKKIDCYYKADFLINPVLSDFLQG